MNNPFSIQKILDVKLTKHVNITTLSPMCGTAAYDDNIFILIIGLDIA